VQEKAIKYAHHQMENHTLTADAASEQAIAKRVLYNFHEFFSEK
jgi:hypothetical protein